MSQQRLLMGVVLTVVRLFELDGREVSNCACSRVAPGPGFVATPLGWPPTRRCRPRSAACASGVPPSQRGGRVETVGKHGTGGFGEVHSTPCGPHTDRGGVCGRRGYGAWRSSFFDLGGLLRGRCGQRLASISTGLHQARNVAGLPRPLADPIHAAVIDRVGSCSSAPQDQLRITQLRRILLGAGIWPPFVVESESSIKPGAVHPCASVLALHSKLGLGFVT